MHVTLAHPHLYEVHWDMAETCFSGPLITMGPLMWAWNLKEV
jgi:hypothetical protein